jgi:hypothetical protein
MIVRIKCHRIISIGWVCLVLCQRKITISIYLPENTDQTVLFIVQVGSLNPTDLTNHFSHADKFSTKSRCLPPSKVSPVLWKASYTTQSFRLDISLNFWAGSDHCIAEGYFRAKCFHNLTPWPYPFINNLLGVECIPVWCVLSRCFTL